MKQVDVKSFRKKLRMTSQELATALGVSISTVSRWENGKSKPSRLALIRLQGLAAEKGVSV
jgi:putative transcriptional regulator